MCCVDVCVVCVCCVLCDRHVHTRHRDAVTQCSDYVCDCAIDVTVVVVVVVVVTEGTKW